jgi:hypothetical protein
LVKKKPGRAFTITIDLFKVLKKIVSIGNLVDSPTQRVGESFLITNISKNSKLKSERLETLCKGPMPNRFMQKTPENPPHCRVPLRRT